jgi:hypothetical protein
MRKARAAIRNRLGRYDFMMVSKAAGSGEDRDASGRGGDRSS